MDIIVQREALLKPLQAVSGVVEKKQTLPILSNVLLTIKNDRLLLTGTDLEIELIGFVPIQKMNAEGTTTVSARKLFDICRTLPDASDLRLTIEKNNLVVSAGGSSFRLNTLPAQDFPSLEQGEYPVKFSIQQSQLKGLLTKTYFAMGQQDVRHYLNGSFLDIGQRSIKCVAADGHRLALTTIQDDRIGDAEAKLILPRKSVLELIRLLNSDGDHDAAISAGESRFQIVTDDYIFTTKLINAQYPDYRRLIPAGTTVAVAERDAIKQALTRASILSHEKFRGVRFQLEQDKLTISANNSDQEHAEEDLPLTYNGSKMEIGFNVAYLLDVVSSITSSSIYCAFTDPNNGVLIKPAEDDESLYVVMPMRL
ncbi:MAG: DNA polymerase III subunit beta [Gammaproteobacteria bacterium RIFCSPHIGHO2_12_FULL_42_10]|nr:MAG: DNA polymerase III subunit beta [Gammaproteobacteria bacterium RIFCSPHIGHO2_12_FULL_42_10]